MRALLRWHTGLDGRGDCCQRGRVYKRERERGSWEDESTTKMAYWPRRGEDYCQGGRVHKRGERRGAGRMRAVLRWHTGLDGRGDCCQRGKGI